MKYRIKFNLTDPLPLSAVQVVECPADPDEEPEFSVPSELDMGITFVLEPGREYVAELNGDDLWLEGNVVLQNYPKDKLEILEVLNE